MNDDLFQRKDIADEQQQHVFDMISDIHRRIDDLNNTFNRIFSVMGVFFAVIAVILPIVLYYLQYLPH